MRNQGSLRLGYFPLPLSEARRIKDCLRYPTSSASTIDPCIGDGAAFLAITADTYARRYGIELDVYRAEQAASVVDELIHGDCLDVYCPVGSFGLAFLTALRLTRIQPRINKGTFHRQMWHTDRYGLPCCRASCTCIQQLAAA